MDLQPDAWTVTLLTLLILSTVLFLFLFAALVVELHTQYRLWVLRRENQRRIQRMIDAGYRSLYEQDRRL